MWVTGHSGLPRPPMMLAAPASQGLEKSGQLGLQVEEGHQLDRWTFTDMLLQKPVASPFLRGSDAPAPNGTRSSEYSHSCFFTEASPHPKA